MKNCSLEKLLVILAEQERKKKMYGCPGHEDFQLLKDLLRSGVLSSHRVIPLPRIVLVP